MSLLNLGPIDYDPSDWIEALGIQHKRRLAAFHPIARWAKPGQFAGHIDLKTDISGEIDRLLLENICEQIEENMNAGNEDLRVDLGVVHDVLGRQNAAVAALEQAEENRDEDAFYPLGRILLLTKLAEKQLNDEGGEAVELLAAQDEEGEAEVDTASSGPSWARIVALLRRAIEADPGNAAAQYYLGKALLGFVEAVNQNDVIDAYSAYLEAGATVGNREEVEKFIESQDPDLQREAAAKRGKAALEAGDIEAAIAAFGEAISLGEYAAYIELAQAYSQHGNHLRAVSSYHAALEYHSGRQGKAVEKKFGYSVNRLFNDPALLAQAIDSLAELDENDKQGRAARGNLLNIAEVVAANIQSWDFALFRQAYCRLAPLEPLGLVGVDKETLASIKANSTLRSLNIFPETAAESPDQADWRFYIEQEGENLLLKNSDGKLIEGVGWLRVNQIVEAVEAVIRWERILKLENARSMLDPAKVEVEVSIAEEGGRRRAYKGDKETTLAFTGKDFSCRFKVKNDLHIDIYVTVLGFSNDYGILSMGQMKVEKNSSGSKPKSTFVMEEPIFYWLDDDEDADRIQHKVLVTTVPIDASIIEQGDRDIGQILRPQKGIRVGHYIMSPSTYPQGDWFSKNVVVKIERKQREGADR